MLVGVQLPETERTVRWPEIQAMARLVEETGFDSIWVGDHLLYVDGNTRKGPWEAWTQLAAVAAVTNRVQIGPLVAALGFHEPAVLAKMAATVDEISSGRLVFGVGAGWNEVEYRAFGLDFDRRVGRFVEAFTIVRRLLAGEVVDHEGVYYRLEGCEILPPPRPGGPPLLIGSNGPRMLAATLPHVNAWNTWYEDYDNDPEAIGSVLDRITEACADAGRDPDTLEKTAAFLLQFGDEPLRRNTHNPQRGTTSEMADALWRLSEAGIDHVQLVLDPITTGSIEAASGVLTALRG